MNTNKLYSDIINLEPPQSMRSKRMPPYERAAQFAPFAALSGFGSQISEKARLTDCRPSVCDEDALMINENIRALIDSDAPVSVSLTYFVPDKRKSGGALVTKTGKVRRVDTVFRRLIFTDRTEAAIDDIFSLDIFAQS